MNSDVWLQSKDSFLSVEHDKFSDTGILFFDNIDDLASESIRDSDSGSVLRGRDRELDQIKALLDAVNDLVSESSLSSHFDAIKSFEDSAEKSAYKVFSIIKDSSYQEGMNSRADVELDQILKNKGEGFLYETFRELWKLCFRSKNSFDFAHFMNCVKNISHKVDESEFLTYAVSAVAHKDILIRESGIAVFEGWDKKEFLPYLENLADTGVDWLDSYKYDVISSLGEEI